MTLDGTTALDHLVGAQVTVLHKRKLVGSGEVNPNNQFEIELADDLRGELEVNVASGHTAPVIVDADGSELNVMIMYAPGGPKYA